MNDLPVRWGHRGFKEMGGGGLILLYGLCEVYVDKAQGSRFPVILLKYLTHRQDRV